MLLRFHIFPDTTKMKAAFKQLSCREKTWEETPDVAKTQPANAGWDSHLPSVGTGKYSGRDFFPLFQQRLLGGRMNSQSLRHGPLCPFFLLTPCAESGFFWIYFSPHIYCIVHPRWMAMALKGYFNHINEETQHRTAELRNKTLEGSSSHLELQRDWSLEQYMTPCLFHKIGGARNRQQQPCHLSWQIIP